LGFAEVRQRGSHRQFRHTDGRGTTVPFHQGRDISPTLLRQVAKDIGLSVEDFLVAQLAVAKGEGRMSTLLAAQSMTSNPLATSVDNVDAS
jgi:predicted RNA binding protein YcfA (HicA-like mRNA interferase family)